MEEDKKEPMKKDPRASEIERRELALKNKGRVVTGSGVVVEPRALPQMVSVRLDPSLVSALREVAKESGETVSVLLRRGAESIVKAYQARPAWVDLDAIFPPGTTASFGLGNGVSGTATVEPDSYADTA